MKQSPTFSRRLLRSLSLARNDTDEIRRFYAIQTYLETLYDYNSLSYSHQREHVGYITEVKREETRAKRIAGTIETLKQGKPENQPR